MPVKALMTQYQFPYSMLLYSILFVLFRDSKAARKCLSFPEDLIPKLVLISQDTSDFPAFTGGHDNVIKGDLKDVQEVKVVANRILISSRNAVYVINKALLKQETGRIPFEQVLYWYPRNDTQCKEKTGSPRICQNYIRVVAPLTSKKILLCGTNAAYPSCREYKWRGTRFTGFFLSSLKQEKLKIPFDDVSSLAYKYFDGHMFSATRVDINQFDAAITRTPVNDADASGRHFARSSSNNGVGSGKSLLVLRTDRDAVSRPLNDPHFVGMTDIEDKIFIFFREEAIEATDTTEKVVYSRVAQVCKNDIGGSNLLLGRWTSFFKARLNCSVPGNRPFYFNEIQDVTEPVMVNGKMIVFATMTTPENSIAGSAVCAFMMQDIASSFAGNFKEQSKTSWCWNRRATAAPTPHPAMCRRNNMPALKHTVLQFIKTHPLMSQSVQAVGRMPLFLSTQADLKFTAIAVETNIRAAGFLNVTMMYIGTQDGKLLKVLVNQSDSDLPRSVVFLEQLEVYQPTSCSQNISKSGKQRLAYQDVSQSENDWKRVKKVNVLPASDVILVTFRCCVISVPRQLCQFYKCKSSCLRASNPYCGWDGERCVTLASTNQESLEQDLFSEHTNTESCSLEEVIIKSSEICEDSVGIAFPLILGLVTSFSLFLLCFLLYMKCWKRSTRRSGFYRTACMKKNSIVIKKQPSFSRGYEDVTINPEMHDCVKPAIPTTDLYHDPPLTNTKTNSNVSGRNNYKNVHIVHNVLRPEPQDNVSSEDTTWSDDLSDSNLNLTDNIEEKYNQPREGRAIEQLQQTHLHTNNNNKVIGIAHPINHKSGKLSQIVKPTFVSKPTKIKLGSQHSSQDYGATQTAINQTSQRRDIPLRIITNPNYLPVTPYVVRSDSDTANDLTSRPVAFPSELFSHKSDNDVSKEKRKLIQVNKESSFDLFPPLPPCVFSPSSKSKLESFSTAPVSSSWYPSPPNVEKQESVNMDANIMNSSKPLSINRNHEPLAISSSASADSASSGFISSSLYSPPIFNDHNLSERKAFIVAKGILSAQTFASPKISKKNKKKKLKVDRNDIVENIYDEVCEGSPTPSLEGSRISECFDEEPVVSFRSPEFCKSSDDDYDELGSPAEPTSTPADEDSRSVKSKKSLRIFKPKKDRKSKKDRVEGLRMQNDETFVSPSYDEEPFVPRVVGWEEIDYCPPNKLESENCSENSSIRPESIAENNANVIGRSYDDSFVNLNGKGKSMEDREDELNFYTMRPKNRMRQKMPKMRNTGKKWTLKNKPVPVPTPALPNAPS